MEIEDKLVAAILTFIRYKNYSSYLGEDEVLRTYMEFLKAVAEEPAEDDFSQFLKSQSL